MYEPPFSLIQNDWQFDYTWHSFEAKDYTLEKCAQTAYYYAPGTIPCEYFGYNEKTGECGCYEVLYIT